MVEALKLEEIEFEYFVHLCHEDNIPLSQDWVTSVQDKKNYWREVFWLKNVLKLVTTSCCLEVKHFNF
jgi:hypothetical protein